MKKCNRRVRDQPRKFPEGGVCVRERKREREKERDRETERDRVPGTTEAPQ